MILRQGVSSSHLRSSVVDINILDLPVMNWRAEIHAGPQRWEYSHEAGIMGRAVGQLLNGPLAMHSIQQLVHHVKGATLRSRFGRGGQPESICVDDQDGRTHEVYIQKWYLTSETYGREIRATADLQVYPGWGQREIIAHRFAGSIQGEIGYHMGLLGSTEMVIDLTFDPQAAMRAEPMYATSRTRIGDDIVGPWDGSIPGGTPLGCSPDAHARAQAIIRRQARNREESERRERHATKQAAEGRAEQLLLSVLTTDQQDQYRRLGAFNVVTQGGNTYRIRKGKQQNIALVDSRGVVREELCAHMSDISLPTCDHMVAQKLMLEADETAFRRVAIITRRM